MLRIVRTTIFITAAILLGAAVQRFADDRLRDTDPTGRDNTVAMAATVNQTPATQTANPAHLANRLYLAEHRGAALRWDPCKTIQYQVNWAHAPEHAEADLAAALAALHGATGLRFEYTGTSDETPQTGRSKDLRSGGRSPVLIAWSGITDSDLLADGKLAKGVAYWVEIGQVREYRGGAIVINAERAGTLHPGFGRRGHATLLLHEWGHVLGLAHSDAGDSVMHHALARGDGRLGPSDEDALMALYPSHGC